MSGILFTANPATGERSEVIVNASFGLGEAVVGGLVTPDTYIVDKASLAVKETVIGPKEQQTVSDGEQGTKMADVAAGERGKSSLSDAMLKELVRTALGIEQLYEGLPQDIEWAFSNGELSLLQSRPITNLPVQPIELEWVPRPPAKYLSRRQIVENMPDPICPLFEELYLTEGLESSRGGKSLMVGGGPVFVTLNGYAYQRFDWPQLLAGSKDKPKAIAESDIEAAEYEEIRAREEIAARKRLARQRGSHELDIEMFAAALSDEDRAALKAWASEQDVDDLARTVAMPVSDNPTYTAFNNTTVNDRQLNEWHEVTRPRLVGICDKWRKVDPATSSDETLFAGIREMGIAFKETQIANDESSDTMRGFPVSSGRITAPASVVLGPADFDKMQPGSILVSPLTTPAWTQLFAHAAGLVTDMGSILAHGSIVAREYGIPAVLGVGTGTVRIKHGQMLTIDGDVGTVVLHEEETAEAS